MVRHTEKLEPAEKPLTMIAVRKCFERIDILLGAYPEMSVEKKRAFKNQLQRAALTDDRLPTTLSDLRHEVRERVNLEGIANETYPAALFIDIYEKGLRAATRAMQGSLQEL